MSSDCATARRIELRLVGNAPPIMRQMGAFFQLGGAKFFVVKSFVQVANRERCHAAARADAGGAGFLRSSAGRLLRPDQYAISRAFYEAAKAASAGRRE